MCVPPTNLCDVEPNMSLNLD